MSKVVKTKHTSLSLNEEKMLLRVVPLIFGVVAISWGVFTTIKMRSTNQLTRFDELFPSTVYINTPSELMSIKRKDMNSQYILMNDLTFESSTDLFDKNIDFTGVLEGNGHTINIKGTAINSLFYKVGSKGEIKDLKINYINDVEPVEKNFGGIATINEGKIQNVKVEFSKTLSLKEHEFVGGIAAINNGEISKSISIVDFKETEKFVKNYSYGGIVGNALGGKVTQIVTMVNSEFLIDHKQDIIDGVASSPKVAYSVAARAEKSETSLIYTLDNEQQFIDRTQPFVTLKSEDELKVGRFYTSAEYGLTFPTKIWKVEDGNIPELIPNCLYVKGGE